MQDDKPSLESNHVTRSLDRRASNVEHATNVTWTDGSAVLDIAKLYANDNCELAYAHLLEHCIAECFTILGPSVNDETLYLAGIRASVFRATALKKAGSFEWVSAADDMKGESTIGNHTKIKRTLSTRSSHGKLDEKAIGCCYRVAFAKVIRERREKSEKHSHSQSSRRN